MDFRHIQTSGSKCPYANCGFAVLRRFLSFLLFCISVKKKMLKANLTLNFKSKPKQHFLLTHRTTKSNHWYPCHYLSSAVPASQYISSSSLCRYFLIERKKNKRKENNLPFNVSCVMRSKHSMYSTFWRKRKVITFKGANYVKKIDTLNK